MLSEFASLEAIIDIFSAVIIESFGMFTDYVFQLFVNSDLNTVLAVWPIQNMVI